MLFSHLAFTPNVDINSLFKKLNIAFNCCIRYIFGLTRFSHISHLQNSILHCSLQQYYKNRSCLFLFKLLKYKTPNYLYLNIAKAASQRSLNCTIPPNVTSKYHNSIFVAGVSLYNSVPTKIKDLTIPDSSFKSSCLANFSNL